MLAGWLEEPRVKRWWNHENADEALERDFGRSLDGDDETEVFVVEVAGTPIGLIQRYRIDSEPEYLEALRSVCTVPAAAPSIDYLIGDPTARGRGVGSAMISAFVADSWAAMPGSNEVLVPVAAGNAASWRALERAGFVRIATGPLTPDNPIDPPDHHVYLLRRADD